MTTIPVGSLPQPTTPRSASQSPRLPLSPRAQQVLKNQAKPVPRLVPRVSVMPGAITPEAKSPRTQPASSSATPRSAAASAETTPRTTTPETARRARSELSEQRIANFATRRSASPQKTYRTPRSTAGGKEPAKQLSASAIDPGRRRSSLGVTWPCARRYHAEGAKPAICGSREAATPHAAGKHRHHSGARRARDAFSRSMTQNCRLDGVRPSGLRWKRGAASRSAQNSSKGTRAQQRLLRSNLPDIRAPNNQE